MKSAPNIKVISSDAISALLDNAAQSERRRAHLNVHEQLDADVQRLFIATQPETYMRPHRHPEAHKWEFFVVLEGKLDLLLFDDSGRVTRRVTLSADDNRAVEVCPGHWHAYVCMARDSLALEIKQGAYLPTTEDDFSPWAPAEKSVDAERCQQWMRSAQPGQLFPPLSTD